MGRIVSQMGLAVYVRGLQNTEELVRWLSQRDSDLCMNTPSQRLKRVSKSTRSNFYWQKKETKLYHFIIYHQLLSQIFFFLLIDGCGFFLYRTFQLFYCSWSSLWWKPHFRIWLFCWTCIVLLFKGDRRDHQIQMHHTHRLMIKLYMDVHHHRPQGDGVLNANVVCNNAARMLCLHRFCLPHVPAQSLTLDWWPWAILLFISGQRRADCLLSSYLYGTQTSSGMLVAFLSVLTVISIAV